MRRIVASILLLAASPPAGAAAPKNILMIINEGFQVDEYFTPRKLFAAQGYKITTASRYGGLVKPGRSYQDKYEPVPADLTFAQIKIEDYDAVTFAGGGGAWSDYFPNKTLHQVLMKAVRNEKMIVGLICAGAGLLGTADNLDGETPQFKGRHVTGYPEVAGLMKTQGQVRYDGGEPAKPYVVEDGRLITGRDPGSAQLFGETIIARLKP